MVRTFTAFFLIGLIAACPLLCGAVEIGHGTHGLETSSGVPGEPSAPGHCPQDGDDCICQGAVQADDARLPGAADDFGLLLPFAHTPPHPIAHLTRDGSPTGLAALGDSSTVRAFLQNFRC